MPTPNRAAARRVDIPPAIAFTTRSRRSELKLRPIPRLLANQQANGITKSPRPESLSDSGFIKSALVGVAVKLALARRFESLNDCDELESACDDALRLAGLPDDMGQEWRREREPAPVLAMDHDV
jgi:hypothetical protein